MSSNIRIQRVCQHCQTEFTAKTTVTKYCGDDCAKRAYKVRKRNERIQESNKQTIATKTIHIEEIKAKDYLTAKDVALLLNCSTKTVYRLIDKGILKATNLSDRMTRIKRSSIDNVLS